MIKRSLAVLLALTTVVPAFSQNLTGIWRGNFFTEDGNTYKFEIQIKQSGSSATGVSYSYLNTVFYGKAVLSGSYNRGGKVLVIRELKTVELRMSALSSACIMRCVLSYAKSGPEEFLEGTYTSKFEKDGLGGRKGDDCGGGRVQLRRVTTSDFYIEPFLRKNYKPAPPVKQAQKTPPVTKTTPPVQKTTKPPVVVRTPPKTTPTNPPVVKQAPPPVVTQTRPDSVKVIPPPVRQQPVVVATPNVLKTRSNELVKTLVVTSKDVLVKLYDNGEIDGDTISVYLDKKLVLASRGLTASPLTLKFRMDEDNADHELVMVAENLGRIPPNTSLMIVEAGDQRFDVRITSTEQKNAVVRFRYQKPD